MRALVDLVNLQARCCCQSLKVGPLALLATNAQHGVVEMGLAVRGRVSNDLLDDEAAAVGRHGICDLAQDADADVVAIVVEATTDVVNEGA